MSFFSKLLWPEQPEPEESETKLIPLTKREKLIRYYQTHDEHVSLKTFRKAFPFDVEYQHYNVDMFRQRANAKLYFFPDANTGVINTGGASRYGSYRIRTEKPPAVAEYSGKPILHVQVGGGSPRAISASGQIYTSNYVEGRDPEFQMVAKKQVVPTPESVPDITKVIHMPHGYPGDGPDVECMDWQWNIAVDSTGRLWLWDDHDQKKTLYFPLLLRCNGRIVRGRIASRYTGRFATACVVEGEGMYVFAYTFEIYKTDEDDARLVEVVDVAHLEGLGDNLVDYALYCDWMIIIRGDYSVIWARRVSVTWKDATAADFSPLEEVNQISQEKGARFIQMSIECDTLVLLSDTGCILYTELFCNELPVRKKFWLTGLQKKHIVRIECCVEYVVALTEEGSVYFWDTYMMRYDDPPKLLDLPGRAYGISVYYLWLAVLASPEKEGRGHVRRKRGGHSGREDRSERREGRSEKRERRSERRESRSERREGRGEIIIETRHRR